MTGACYKVRLLHMRSKRRLYATIIGLILVSVGTERVPSGSLRAAPPAQGRASDEVFADGDPIRIAIEISPAGIGMLARARPTTDSDAKIETEATIVEAGRIYTTVAVHLKGFSSFQPIGATPSFTLNFDKLVTKQSFHGLEKISLNNSLQDDTRLNEVFSREVFAAAGVPVPRATYALVTLNGRELGLYVLTEGFDKRFLERHFARSDGNLYEGGFLTDITQGLQLLNGKNPADDPSVAQLIRAADEPDPEMRFRAIAAALDVDRFLSMVAIETMLCHSDSYSMNRNNYRIYHDPATDKIVFMPHGMDRVLGMHRSELDLSLVPPRLGLIARALLSTAEGRRRYVERAGVLFNTVFQPEVLCRRAREIGGRIGAGRGASELCAKISTRAADLAFQLADPIELRQVTPAPAFDPSGTARLSGWRLVPKPGQPRGSASLENQGGEQVVHVNMPAAPLVASLRTRFALPAGRYQLSGQFAAFGGAQGSSPVDVACTMVRIAPGRWDYDRRQWGRDIKYAFQVSSSVSPEEIELTCEVAAKSSDVWIDPSSLSLSRLGG